MKKTKGFTLIELVVVMAIIAVLVALMVAALQAARNSSIESQRRANVKTVETALEAKYSRVTSYTTTAATFKGIADELKNAGFLSQDLPGVTSDTTPGYKVITQPSGENYEILACAINVTDVNCTAANALYIAKRGQ